MSVRRWATVLVPAVVLATTVTHAGAADAPAPAEHRTWPIETSWPESSADAAPVETSPIGVPGEIVVVWQPDAGSAARAAARRDVGAASARAARGLPDVELLEVAPDRVDAVLARLARDPLVRAVDRNLVVRGAQTGPPVDDPRFADQWALHNTGQTTVAGVGTPDADIDAPEAWTLGGRGDGVVVAVLDSGVDLSHPDLVDRLWTNPAEIAGNGIDDDGNGYVDDVHGWDWVIDYAGPPPYAQDNDPADRNGHGTHVAGTIAATADNATGIAGVAPEVELMVLRALDHANTGSFFTQAEAAAYAADMGATVVNGSFGGYGSVGEVLFGSVAAAAPDTLFVFGAMNDANDNDLTPAYPCAIDAPNVICVAATDHDDERAGFSNYGSTTVDLAAPGVGVLSTFPGRTASWLHFFGLDATTGWTTGGAPDTWGLEAGIWGPGDGSVLSDSPTGPHGADVDTWAASPAVDLSGTHDWCRLRHAPSWELGAGDRVEVQVRAGGVGWTSFWVFSGDSGGFLGQYDQYLSLPGWVRGQADVQVRYRLVSDGADEGDGFRVGGAEIWCFGPDPDYSGAPGAPLVYDVLDGTSMAAPHVAGAAALLFGADPTATVAEVKAALLDSVDPVPSLAGVTVTGGRLNAHAALEALLAGPPTITPGLGAVTEGDTGTVTLEMPVTLSSPSATPVSVDWETLDTGGSGVATPGIDLAPGAGTLTFTPGDTEETVTLTVNGDLVDEPDLLYGEWALVRFSDPVGATIDPSFFGLGVGVIVDDDPPPVITPGAGVVTEGDAGSVFVDVPVTLSNPSAEPVTVDWATISTGAPGIATPGLDYVGAAGTLTFPPGETAAMVTIEVLGDTLDEPPAVYGEWILVSFTNASATAVLDTSFFGLGLGIVVDDDP